ncbi:MAG: hypothetical protein ACFFC1_21760 [Promethearchaeota archaeon]
MTVMEPVYEFETQIWRHQLSLNKKLEILRQYFNVISLEKVSFWKLYKIVKKLNSN